MIYDINLLHVSTLGCHPQTCFPNKGMQTQNVDLGMYCPHWSD